MAFSIGIIPIDENIINLALSFTSLKSSLKEETGAYLCMTESQKDLFRTPIYLTLSSFLRPTMCMCFPPFYTYIHYYAPLRALLALLAYGNCRLLYPGYLYITITSLAQQDVAELQQEFSSP